MQKIRIDFDNPGLPQHISAVENDSQSRFFQATLYENGKAYTAPAGASYSIMYSGFGPQNQGWYDTINDGAGKRAACKASGNVVTCEIARQALQVPGHVSIVLCVTTGKGYMLKSWPIECDCKNDRYDSTAEIESFFYITQISNADWTQAIQAVKELKNTIDPTLSLSGKAADAKATGDAVGQLKEDIGDIEKSLFDFVNLSDYEILNGYGITSNGYVVKTDHRCASRSYIYSGFGGNIIVPDNLKINVAVYTGTTESTIVNYIPFGKTVINIPSGVYFRFGLGYSDDGEIASTEDILSKVSCNIIRGSKFEQVEANIDSGFSQLFANDVWIPHNVPSSYYKPVSEKEYDLFKYESNQTSYTSYIEAVDNLIQDYRTVSKEILGKDSSGEYDIVKYSIKPLNISDSLKKIPNPKIFITAGIHGFERASVYSLFMFVRDLLENYKKDEVLDYIRNNIEIVFIPCANPYGFSKNIYVNYNDVNINRNFEYNWQLATKGNSEYGGEAPFSEVETQYIRDIILNDKPWLFLDFHTTGMNNDVQDITYYNWIGDANSAFLNKKSVYANHSHLMRLSRMCVGRYGLDISDSDVIGRITHSVGHGTSNPYACSKGVLGICVEMTPKFKGQEAYNENVIKFGSEIIGNYIMAIIREHQNFIKN